MNFHGFTYVEGDTLVHRCDARVKIVCLLAYSIGIFFARSWWGMAMFVGVVVLLAAIARIPLSRLLLPLVPVIVLAAFALLFAFVADPTLQGFLAGLFVAIRMIALVAASFIVCLTTTSTDLLAAFTRLIGPLRHIRVPVDDVAITLSLALRFIPVIAEEFTSVRAAQIARGASMQGVPFTRKLQIWGAAFSAVFVGLFRRADALATAMDSRCYGALEKRASLR